MGRVSAGTKMPDFKYVTPFKKDCRLSECVRQVEGKTAVVFLRYYGCTLCQYDIQLYAESYASLKQTGGQFLVVLQSDPEKLSQQISEEYPPFDIICDPEQELYKMLEIHAAGSKEEMVDAHAMEKITIARASGLTHGEYEGEELQLPAAFVMDRELNLTYVRYCKTVGEVPTPKELEELLK